MKYIYPLCAALLVLIGAPAFAQSPCSTYSNLAQLAAARSCTAGPNGGIKFSSFSTNINSSQWDQVLISAVIPHSGMLENPGLYGIGLDISRTHMSVLSFSYLAECNTSCQFNDAVGRLNNLDPNSGTGKVWVNGSQSDLGNGVTVGTPVFPYTRSASSYISWSGSSEVGYIEVALNLIPGDWGSSGSTGNGGSSNICPAK